MSTIVPYCSDPRVLPPEKATKTDIRIVAPALTTWYATSKIVGDFVLALLLFIVTAPLLLAAMVLVKLMSRGPALYLQLRTGRGGKPFAIYKIRSMHHQVEKHSGVQWASANDTRAFPLGRWYRKLHIDELPQLWNVIRGDMGLIGPRPERPEFVPQLEKAIPHYRRRLLVRPGVTGLAQVQLPADSDLHSVRVKLAYDLYYLRHMNWWLDARIFAATFGKMIGLPFAVIRLCFGLPLKEVVLAEFHNLGPNAKREPNRQREPEALAR